MKNEAALKSMAKMIQAMLPYEPDYEPTSLGTVCLSDMFEALKIHSPEIVEFEGVFNYVLRGMDVKNDSKLDDFLVELRDIMIASYPVASPKDIGHLKDSDVDDYPEDLGEDNDPDFNNGEGPAFKKVNND